MSWLELSVNIHRREWPRVERALEDLGALSVTLLDAEDAPILEPGVGETPLWPEVVVNALLAAGSDRRGLAEALAELAHAVDPDQVQFRDVGDQDWTRAWMDQYRPMRFGERLWVYPTTVEPPDDPGIVVVRLDPGLAFGTGTHPTTALCLRWLDAQDLSGRTLVDFGCGSGVLAIAALKLGAARAIAIDNDPQALVATRANAQRNGVEERIVLAEPGMVDAHGDVVVANILAGTLVQLAPQLVAATAPGGAIALSGVLREQAGEVMAAYARFLTDMAVEGEEDWVRIDGRRL